MKQIPWKKVALAGAVVLVVGYVALKGTEGKDSCDKILMPKTYSELTKVEGQISIHENGMQLAGDAMDQAKSCAKACRADAWNGTTCLDIYSALNEYKKNFPKDVMLSAQKTGSVLATKAVLYKEYAENMLR
jgi:hypothetical protein